MKILRILLPTIIAFTVGMFGAEWLAKQTQYDFGIVVVRLGGYDFSTGLPQTILLLATLILLLWLVWSGLLIPFRAWRNYKQKQDLSRFVDGLRHADIGQWQRAEQLLVTASQNPLIGSVAITGALRCAEWGVDSEHCDSLLQQLNQMDPELYVLEQSERLLNQGQNQRALELLETMNDTASPRAQWLRLRALVQERRALDALLQLESLRQQGYADNAHVAPLEHTAYQLVLEHASDLETLSIQWNNLSDAMQVDPTLVRVYTERALAFGADEAAILKHLESVLKTHFEDQLVVFYASLPLKTSHDRLNFLQTLQSSSGPHSGLLTALAALYLDQDKLDQSFELISQSIQHGETSASWDVLSRLFMAKDHLSAALKCQKNAIQLLQGKPITTPFVELEQAWHLCHSSQKS